MDPCAQPLSPQRLWWSRLFYCTGKSCILGCWKGDSAGGHADCVLVLVWGHIQMHAVQMCFIDLMTLCYCVHQGIGSVAGILVLGTDSMHRTWMPFETLKWFTWVSNLHLWSRKTVGWLLCVGSWLFPQMEMFGCLWVLFMNKSEAVDLFCCT